MPSDGYKLYAWLLAQIPSDVAEALHSQQDHPISQFVTFDKEKDNVYMEYPSSEYGGFCAVCSGDRID